MKKPHGVPVSLTPEARRIIRETIRQIIQERGHRDYRFPEIAERTGYSSGSIYRYVMSHADKSLRPRKRKKRIYPNSMEKPQYVEEVEKHTGLTAHPYRHVARSKPEWRLMSPTGVLLFVLIGEEDLLHAIRTPVSMASIQGITGLVRKERQAEKRRRKTEILDIEKLTDDLWEKDENE